MKESAGNERRSGAEGGGEGGGRPAPLSPEDTRERLLRVGRELMARNGFDGTSIRALTEAADANLGAVTYHFKSKEGLYHAVLQDVLGPLRDQVQLLKEMPFSPLQKLEYFIRGMFQHLRENPDMPRFMVQEIVLGENPAPSLMETVRLVAPVLTGIIQEGQAVGTIRKGDPVLMALSTISQPIYLSIMPPVLARAQEGRVGIPQPRGLPEEHAVEFVIRGLEAREPAEVGGGVGGSWTAWREGHDEGEEDWSREGRSRVEEDRSREDGPEGEDERRNAGQGEGGGGRRNDGLRGPGYGRRGGEQREEHKEEDAE